MQLGLLPDSSVMVECVEGLQLAVGVPFLRFLLQDWYGCNIVDLGTDVSFIRFFTVCVVRTYQGYSAYNWCVSARFILGDLWGGGGTLLC